MEVHGHKTVGSEGGGMTGRRSLGGPSRHRLPLPIIMSSSWGMLYTFFLGAIFLLTTTPGSLVSPFSEHLMGAEARSLVGR